MELHSQIRFNLVVQSQKQLQSRYEAEAETIKSNCNNWIFLTSRELSLLKEISELAGTVSGKPLISVSALQHLKKNDGEALVFRNRLFPFITRLEDISIYDNEQYEVRPLKKRPVPIASHVHIEDAEDTTERALNGFKKTEDEEMDKDEVIILKLESADDVEKESYVSVDDEGTLQAVFSIFKEKFKDEFDFTDD